jgi:hypothetical protein
LISDIQNLISDPTPDTRYLTPETCYLTPEMRAEIETIVAEIKQSIGLLRRHL